MKEKLNEMIFLYQLSEELYKKPALRRIPLSEVNLNVLVELSIKNNMLYYHCKKILEFCFGLLSQETLLSLNNIVEEGDIRLKKIHSSVSLLNECLGDYLLIKTYRGYPRIPSDLDVLVRNFDAALKIIVKNGFKIADLSGKNQDAQLIKENFYKVHLHGKIHWADAEFMDSEFIFKNPRSIDFFGEEVKIPNFDADFLMHLAHINFEPLYITLSDLLYIYNLSPLVNWNVLFAQSQRYSWDGALLNTLEIMDHLHHTIYEPPCPFSRLKFKHTASRKQELIILPLTLPRAHLIKTCIKKKLFKYALLKASKSFKILLSGDSYSGYYFPTQEAPLLNKGSHL